MNDRSSGARRILLPVVASLASLAARVIRSGARVSSPLVRFGRLAHLKAFSDGVVPVSTQFDGRVEVAGRVRLELGERCRFGRRVFLETCDGGAIRIGANVRLNSGAFIVSYEEVSIGADTLIGEYVSIRDADHGLSTDRPIRVQPHSASPIHIGEGVWIGRGSVVLKGVTIGAGAVIAANSVVTRDVPPLAIVAGAPARVLRRRGDARPAQPVRGSPSAPV
jgi:acetyltransferase-like isoleucine patch superfamily enzyme